MDRSSQKTILYIAFGVGLFAALMNLSSVLRVIGRVFDFFLPVIVGLIVAFILSVPMKGFENLLLRVFGKSKRPPRGKLLRGISLLLTVVSLAAVVAAVLTLTVPQISASVSSIVSTVSEKWPEWMKWLDAQGINTESLAEWAEHIDLENLAQSLFGGAGLVIGSVVDASVSIVSLAATACIAAVIAFYVLMDRDNLARQAKRLLYTYTKEKYADAVCRVARLVHKTYTQFLSGQCVEAVILGVLMALTFSVFGLPYAWLIGMLAGVCAFIPYVGAIAACAIGAFLILMIDPSKTLLCIAVYSVTQFIENQFIYPHVVGTSVGLPPLWTFIAALIGGKLFGLPGILFFIPLTAVEYSLLRADVEKKESAKSKMVTSEQ